MKDAGLVKDGPETARLYRGKTEKALLLWDYHGSGQEKRYSPEQSEDMIQRRLDGISWADNSGAVVIVPELEAWLWCTAPSVARYLSVEQVKWAGWLEGYATKRRSTVVKVVEEQPKEVFEYICIEKLKRSISPRDFEEIGRIADISALEHSRSFAKILSLLRTWFPLSEDEG